MSFSKWVAYLRDQFCYWFNSLCCYWTSQCVLDYKRGTLTLIFYISLPFEIEQNLLLMLLLFYLALMIITKLIIKCIIIIIYVSVLVYYVFCLICRYISILFHLYIYFFFVFCLRIYTTRKLSAKLVSYKIFYKVCKSYQIVYLW